jgi:hypothetical protein
MMRKTTELPDLVPQDIAGALDELGIVYRVVGDEATALCPHPEHDDAKPSWSCNLKTGKHNCFSCGFGGSFEWLVRIVTGTRKGEAVAWIRTRKPRVVQKEKAQGLIEISEADLWEAAEPPAWHLADRGISADAAKEMELLFNYRTRRWVFPLRDPYSDRLIGWQEKGTGDERHLVLNKPDGAKKHLTLFGFRHLKWSGNEGPVIIIENPVKTARFVDAGLPRVVSTCGSSFSEEQINLLWPYADEIVFALDNDAAGYKAMANWIKNAPFGRSKIKVFNYGARKIRGAYVHFKDDRDPGDLTMEEIIWGYENRTPAAFSYFEGVDWEV